MRKTLAVISGTFLLCCLAAAVCCAQGAASREGKNQLTYDREIGAAVNRAQQALENFYKQKIERAARDAQSSAAYRDKYSFLSFAVYPRTYSQDIIKDVPPYDQEGMLFLYGLRDTYETLRQTPSLNASAAAAQAAAYIALHPRQADVALGSPAPSAGDIWYMAFYLTSFYEQLGAYYDYLDQREKDCAQYYRYAAAGDRHMLEGYPQDRAEACLMLREDGLDKNVFKKRQQDIETFIKAYTSAADGLVRRVLAPLQTNAVPHADVRGYLKSHMPAQTGLKGADASALTAVLLKEMPAPQQFIEQAEKLYPTLKDGADSAMKIAAPGFAYMTGRRLSWQDAVNVLAPLQYVSVTYWYERLLNNTAGMKRQELVLAAAETAAAGELNKRLAQIADGLFEFEKPFYYAYHSFGGAEEAVGENWHAIAANGQFGDHIIAQLAADNIMQSGKRQYQSNTLWESIRRRQMLQNAEFIKSASVFAVMALEMRFQFDMLVFKLGGKLVNNASRVRSLNKFFGQDALTDNLSKALSKASAGVRRPVRPAVNAAADGGEIAASAVVAQRSGTLNLTGKTFTGLPSGAVPSESAALGKVSRQAMPRTAAASEALPSGADIALPQAAPAAKIKEPALSSVSYEKADKKLLGALEQKVENAKVPAAMDENADLERILNADLRAAAVDQTPKKASWWNKIFKSDVTKTLDNVSEQYAGLPQDPSGRRTGIQKLMADLNFDQQAVSKATQEDIKRLGDLKWKMSRELRSLDKPADPGVVIVNRSRAAAAHHAASASGAAQRTASGGKGVSSAVSRPEAGPVSAGRASGASSPAAAADANTVMRVGDSLDGSKVLGGAGDVSASARGLQASRAPSGNAAVSAGKASAAKHYFSDAASAEIKVRAGASAPGRVEVRFKDGRVENWTVSDYDVMWKSAPKEVQAHLPQIKTAVPEVTRPAAVRAEKPVSSVAESVVTAPQASVQPVPVQAAATAAVRSARPLKVNKVDSFVNGTEHYTRFSGDQVKVWFEDGSTRVLSREEAAKMMAESPADIQAGWRQAQQADLVRGATSFSRNPDTGAVTLQYNKSGRVGRRTLSAQEYNALRSGMQGRDLTSLEDLELKFMADVDRMAGQISSSRNSKRLRELVSNMKQARTAGTKQAVREEALPLIEEMKRSNALTQSDYLYLKLFFRGGM